MTIQTTAIIGSGRTVDRTTELVEAIIAACLNVGDGLPFVAVLGCIDVAKDHIMQRQKDSLT